VTPYEPVTVPITFDGAANSVTLPTIGEDVQFLLPRTKTNPLFNLIKGETMVTTDADASGSYSDEGEIEIPNALIHLNECFDTHFTVTLTTGNVTIPNNLPKNLLRTAGFDLTEDQTQIFGSPINDGASDRLDRHLDLYGNDRRQRLYGRPVHGSHRRRRHH
jgi:hypothetical protein